MRKLLLALALSLVTRAALPMTPSSLDVTDLWWNPDESGWGVNVVQQGTIAFATFFVYDSNGRAHWYVASNLNLGASSATSATFSGDLLETQGPYFAIPFNPSAVSRSKVGTATLRVDSPGSGTLVYTVNGTTVTKAIRRQTWAVNDASGTYEGSRTIGSASSSLGCNIGTSSFSNVRISQSNDAFSMVGTLAGSTCTFTGNYSQEGHLGASSGSFSCDNGTQGSYAITQLETTLYGFFARYSGTERGCTVDGRIGGVRTSIVRQPAE